MVSIVHAARDLARIRDISKVLVRHGFGEIVGRLGLGKKVLSDGDPDSPSTRKGRASAGQRIRHVLEDLGTSFIKLGQIASTRPDLLPQDVVSELKKLLDNVPPVDVALIRQRVETSLGAPIEELFHSFDDKPLAAASVAQVHRARLQTSEGLREVVVKVQRPGIAETVTSDLDLLHTFAALLEQAVPETRIYSPVALVQQFDRAMQNELDFTIERDNCLRFASNFSGVEGARFPVAYHEVCSKHVITLEYLDGAKIHDAVRQGFNGDGLVRLALSLIVKQIFEDGFFHADPHPGNVLVLGTSEKPEFALIDLGLVGRLGPRLRDLTVDLMVAAARKDYESVADALYSIATPTRKVNLRTYRAEIAVLADQYLGRPLKDIELSGLIHQLIATARRFGLEVPPDFTLVAKALITLEGVGKEIAPDFDIWEESRPLFLEVLRKRYSPQKIGNELLRRMERLGGATSQLPEQIQEVFDDLRFGRLVIRTTDTETRESADRLGRRIHSALLCGSCLLAGTALLISEREVLGYILFGVAGFAGFMHVMLDAYRSMRARRQ